MAVHKLNGTLGGKKIAIFGIALRKAWMTPCNDYALEVIDQSVRITHNTISIQYLLDAR
jgi:hypothetical protein